MELEAQVDNLLEETEAILKENKLTLRAVKYIRNKEGYITTADFTQQADLLTYTKVKDGRPVVDPSLKIVGGSWWLERVVVDGIEQWAFRKKPQRPALQAVDVNLRNIHV